MMTGTTSRGERRRGGRSLLASVLVLAVALTACNTLDDALNVEAAGFVDADQLNDPQHAELLVTGAISDFDCAFGAYIVNGALLGNELADASVTAARFNLDARRLTPSEGYGTNGCNGNPPGIYGPLATARWAADNAIEKLDEWTDAEVEDRGQLIGTAAAYSGYTHVLIGEGFCSAVVAELGPEVTPQQVFEQAEARFTRAITEASAAGDEQTLNFATLGRARARLNLGNMGGAASDAEDLLQRDPAFEHVATASIGSTRRWNRVAGEWFLGRSTVAPAFRDLMVGGVPDTRVDVEDTGRLGQGSDRNVFIATKYGENREGPLPIATWREAHLIIAEAADGGSDAVDAINVLRNHWSLPTFASSDPDEIRAQVVEERSRELFLESHHLGDLRRFDLDFLPATGTAYRQGGEYGNTQCFPLPDVERVNNPSVN